MDIAPKKQASYLAYTKKEKTRQMRSIKGKKEH